MSHIRLKKVKVHNLKGVDLTLAHNQLIAFSGVSGSGKTSLAFDTIYAEGQRRYIESLSPTLRRRLDNLPKPDAEISGLSPTLAIEQRSAGRTPRATVGTTSGVYDFLRVLFARIGIPHCPVSGEVVSPQSEREIVAKLKDYPQGTKMILLAPFAKGKKGEFKEEIDALLRKGWTRMRLDGRIVELEEELRIDKRKAHTIEIVVDRLVLHPEEEGRLVESVRQALELGEGTFIALFPEKECEKIFSQWAYSPASGLSYGPLEPVDFSFNHPLGMCPTCQGMGGACPDCRGARIRPYPRAATIGGKRIDEITALPLNGARQFFRDLMLSSLEKQVAGELCKEISSRLDVLCDVGLEYLTLDRSMPSLSGGEAQRVRLSAHLGSGLVGVTYVLDEPSIGLHPQDHASLLKTLYALRDRGNTVIVVEHDRGILSSADHIVDIGPLAGKEGGEILFSGTVEGLLSCKRSLTGDYLAHRKKSPKSQSRVLKEKLRIEKASHHNLQGIDVSIPLHGLVAVAGVSGSGKSSLILDTLYPALANVLERAALPVGKHKALRGGELVDKVIAIDQSPIGRTPRSNPATFIKVFDAIRALYAQLPQSRSQGLDAGHFSFNSPDGACAHCGGMGLVRIDMDFLEDAWIPCPRCEGKRFEAHVLSVLFRGKSIADVLEMSVQDAAFFFGGFPPIAEKLDLLVKVGLGYLPLGQASPTLSGGEAQRMKLARELARPAGKHTLYILDEPTTGLHFHDVAHLVEILQELVGRNNSVLVIEHNLDLIRAADWVIELGPTGGAQGGLLLGEGTPAHIATLETPTGKSLRERPPLPKRVNPESRLEHLHVKGAEEHTLKRVDAELPRGKITICCGPSGSGKSSFAFDTIYAEGQRRYSEALSPYARSLVKLMPKPRVEEVTGLSPAIAIEQKAHATHLRSTVGTLSEIYDYVRLLYAHMGTAYCPETKEMIETITKEKVVEQLLALPSKSKLTLLAPLQVKHTFSALKEQLQAQGFMRIELNGVTYPLEEEIPYDANHTNDLCLVVDRLVVAPTAKQRIADAVAVATAISSGVLLAQTDKERLLFNLSFAVPSTGRSYPPLTPQTFSFNAQQGMCPECRGLGVQFGAQLAHRSEVTQLTPQKLFALLCKGFYSTEAAELFARILAKHNIAQRLPIHKLSAEQKEILFSGENEGTPWRWIGFDTALETLAKSARHPLSHALRPLLEESTCAACKGSRLNPLARHVTIQGMSIAQLCQLSLDDALDWARALQNVPPFLQEVHAQICTRLSLLQQLGTGYLSLHRAGGTLSGGEMQRLRLARQLGSGLTGSLYVLDEPTIGLHPHDTERLQEALDGLVRLGNTLLLVEHEPALLRRADYILDFGPKAGREGGTITARGSVQEIAQNPHSLTGAYLSGKRRSPVPKTRRRAQAHISLKGASLHNLKHLDLEIPLGIFTCITGVSGSGKSTLVQDLIRPAVVRALTQRASALSFEGAHFFGLDGVEQVIAVDQGLLSHSTRADVSTYAELLSPLRQFFAQLPEARARGLAPKHFSWNQRSGMCTTCFGQGTKRVFLQYLPPVMLTCPACHGFRLNPMSLSITYQGKHLGQLLQMRVEDAAHFLPEMPKLKRILHALISVGLGYIPFGQELATLSGGEGMRLKLARELAKRAKPKALYLFDEPTIGLHPDDVATLTPLLHALVDQGHTVIVIEHNVDIMVQADLIIDMGPGSGAQGGEIVAIGTPEEIAQHPHALTSPFVKERLSAI